MGGAKKSTWIGGSVFVALVFMAAAWFLAVSPTMSQAADLRDQTEQVDSNNDVLQSKITKLATDFKNLPEYQKQLAALRIQVPTTAQLSDYLRQVDKIATAHSVVVTAISPSAAQEFVPAVAPVSTPTPTPSATDSAEPTATDTSSPATDTGEVTDENSAPASPTGPSGIPAGFAAIPVSLTVVGTYDNTLAFLSDLQTGTPRLFLVSGFTGTSQQKAEASGGRPATKVGDQELTVTGYLYVLPDSSAPAAPAPEPSASSPAPSATPAPTPSLPAAVPGKDPLVPVAGQ